MYCVSLRLPDIKKITSAPVEYTMEVHLADALYFTFLVKVLPPPFHYGIYLYIFLYLYIYSYLYIFLYILITRSVPVLT